MSVYMISREKNCLRIAELKPNKDRISKLIIFELNNKRLNYKLMDNPDMLHRLSKKEFNLLSKKHKSKFKDIVAIKRSDFSCKLWREISFSMNLKHPFEEVDYVTYKISENHFLLRIRAEENSKLDRYWELIKRTDGLYDLYDTKLKHSNFITNPFRPPSYFNETRDIEMIYDAIIKKENTSLIKNIIYTKTELIYIKNHINRLVYAGDTVNVYKENYMLNGIIAQRNRDVFVISKNGRKTKINPDLDVVESFGKITPSKYITKDIYLDTEINGYMFFDKMPKQKEFHNSRPMMPKGKGLFFYTNPFDVFDKIDLYKYFFKVKGSTILKEKDKRNVGLYCKNLKLIKRINKVELINECIKYKQIIENKKTRAIPKKMI